MTVPFIVVVIVLAWAPQAAAQDGCMEAFQATQELRKSGQLLEAREQAVACGKGSCPEVIGKKCREWVPEIDATIPSVVVTVKDASGKDSGSATLHIDDKEHPLDGRAIKLNPGQHEFVAQLPGEEPLRETILIGEGDDNRRIEMSYAPEVDPEPVPRGGEDTTTGDSEAEGIHPLVFVGFGVAAAGIIVGAITGGLALDGGSDVENNCNDKVCPESERDGYDSSLIVAHVSTASFAVAGAGAVVGVIGLLLSDMGADEEADAVEARLGPGWVGVGGRF